VSGAVLRRVASYDRVVSAPIERAWENVRDWEHLPWLHRSSFRSIELIEQSRSGWRARIGLHPAAEIVLELAIDASGERYVSRTLEGRGAGGEIWTALTANSSGSADSAGSAGSRDSTAVHVTFDLPGLEAADEARIASLGNRYRALYTRLWDEDEAMMRGRAWALARRAGPQADRVELGPRDALRLPLDVEANGRSVRVLEVDGVLVAHTRVCPHWLGPLASADGGRQLTCPWHGHAFDATSGRSCDGRALQLAPAPRVELDPRSGRVSLVWNSASRS